MTNIIYTLYMTQNDISVVFFFIQARKCFLNVNYICFVYKEEIGMTRLTEFYKLASGSFDYRNVCVNELCMSGSF